MWRACVRTVSMLMCSSAAIWAFERRCCRPREHVGLAGRQQARAARAPVAVARRQLQTARGEVDRVEHVAGLGRLRQAGGSAEGQQLRATRCSTAARRAAAGGCSGAAPSARAPRPGCAGRRVEDRHVAAGAARSIVGELRRATRPRPRASGRGSSSISPRRPRASRSSKRPTATVMLIAAPPCAGSYRLDGSEG